MAYTFDMVHWKLQMDSAAHCYLYLIMVIVPASGELGRIRTFTRVYGFRLVLSLVEEFVM